MPDPFMSETPPNIWKRPWKGPAKVLAWFGLLVAASFVALYCIALLTAKNASAPELTSMALAVSLVLAGLVTAGFFFVRWLCSWRNFRRFLFVVTCLVTLVALFYAQENWRGRRAWQNYRRECEARGEKFSLAALAPRAVPDEKNFALTPLLKPAMDFTQGPNGTVWHDTNGVARLERISAELAPARYTNDHLVLGSVEKGTFANLSACAEFYRGNTNYPQAPGSASASDTILVALGRFGSELDELREAAATRPYSRFAIPYDYEPPWGILIPHLARVKGLTTLTHVRAMAELEAGGPVEAFADLNLGLRLSDCIDQEPLLIDHLVRVASMAINLQTIREGLVRHTWTDAQLAELEKHLASVHLLAEYLLAMRGERALETQGMDYLRRQGFRTNPMDYLGSEDGASASTPGLPFNPMPAGWYYQNMLTGSRMFDKFTFPAVDAQAHRVFPQVSEAGARALQEMRTGPYTLFVKLLFPALGRAVQRSARMQTYVDAARVACALERYRLAKGRLPDTLEELIPGFVSRLPNDVIDGKSLRYRHAADGSYVLYSVGWNQTDEGGKVAWSDRNREKPAVDITEGDWVWSLPGHER